jgi:hypothetical protein
MVAASLPGAHPPYFSPRSHTEVPPGSGTAERTAPPIDVVAAVVGTRMCGAGSSGRAGRRRDGGTAGGDFTPVVPSTSWAGPGTSESSLDPWPGCGLADDAGPGGGGGGADTLVHPVAAQAVSSTRAREDRRTCATLPESRAPGYSPYE